MMKDLILDDVDVLSLEYRSSAGFLNFFGMSITTFETLLNMIAPKITKRNTTFREAVPAHERLAFTLRFLATGDSYHSLSYTFKISKQVLSKAIPEVCDAIVEAIQDVIKMPENESEWKTVMGTFERWNYPNCVGAMDGKHISLQAPINSGTEYFNYKGYHSVVLLAVVDGNYNFIYASVGCQGRISDAGIFNATQFKKFLEDNTMHLPQPCQLPGATRETPAVFLGDDAFPMSVNIMKPFPGVYNIGSPERIFNYRLSRARQVSENVFGIMTSIFRVLRKPMLLEPSIATKIVLAVIHLHNFLRRSPSKRIYNPPGSFDKEGPDGNFEERIWRKDRSHNKGLISLKNVPRRSPLNAQEVRKEFMKYFLSPQGEVHFQYNK